MPDIKEKPTEIKKARVKKNIDWGYYGVIILLIMGSTYLIFGFTGQQMDINKLQKQKASILSQMKTEEKAIEKLKKNLKETGTPDFIERQARETLGMVKPGETVYIDLNKQE